MKLAGAGPHKTARALSAKGYGSVADGKFQANAAGRAKIAK